MSSLRGGRQCSSVASIMSNSMIKSSLLSPAAVAANLGCSRPLASAGRLHHSGSHASTIMSSCYTSSPLLSAINNSGMKSPNLSPLGVGGGGGSAGYCGFSSSTSSAEV